MPTTDIEDHSDIQLADGVEPVDEMPKQESEAPAEGAYAYGGAIPGPKLTEDNADDFARRLIAWSFATAPLFYRADGGAVEDPAQTAVDTARQINPMGFYSAAAEAASKFPQKAPIDQIINKIKGQPNVKKEELDNANLADAFAGQRSVDPKEVARHLQESLPKISEKVYGGKPAVKYEPKALLERPKGFENADDVYEVGPNGKPPHLIAVNGDNFDVWGPSGYHNSYESLKDAVEHANNSINNIEQFLYKEYTIPGGENYREVVMTLPHEKMQRVGVTSTGQIFTEEELKNPVVRRTAEKIGLTMEDRLMPIMVPYKSSHWMGISNPLAHLRMSDRDNGKTLHLEELQSDWGQEGRKNGFAPDESTFFGVIQDFEKAKKDLNDKAIELHSQGLSGDKIVNHPDFVSINNKKEELSDKVSDLSKKARSGIPSGPYVTDTNQWVDLGLKRALMEAAKGGYDKLIWTPGEQQAARYDLSKQIKSLFYDPSSSRLIANSDNGRLIDENVPKEQLANTIGKEAAEKLLNTEPKDVGGLESGTKFHSLVGQDLSIGGEGMKAFYDKLVPQRLNKLVAQYDKDVKVAPHSHSLKGKESEVKAHAIQITPKLREAILKGGLPAFEHGGTVIDKAFKVLSKLRR
jgi:hypothetical protein